MNLSFILRARPGQRSLFVRFATIFIAAYALFTGAAAQILVNSGNTGASALVQTGQVRAELIAHAPDGVAPGQTIWAGLQIQHQPHWHTYWQNPGDSGLPTTLQWTLPAGVSAGPIAWPVPRRMTVGNLVNYGFEDTVLLPVPLTIGKEFVPNSQGALELRLGASWLVCRQECIPQEGQFVLQVPAQGSTAAHGSAFANAQAQTPQALNGQAQARLEGTDLVLSVQGLPAAWTGKPLLVLPEGTNLVEPARTPHPGLAAQTGATPATGQQSWAHDQWHARLPLSALRETAPTQLGLVLALQGQGLRAQMPVQGTWPALVNPATGPLPAVGTGPAQEPLAAPPGAASSSGLGSLALALLAALLGGLILNLMPCVLPVLAIKVLGFTTHNHHGHTSHRAQGLAYTAGVVLSFLALGGLMLALRATGEQLGWGFQLQSPWVVAVLATLFTLIGLNLAGLFEVGNLLPHQLASLQARHPVVDAFLSGVLAVAIASPCTAPFMGASLGYAITLPAAQALAIFAALGMGLALPFLAASWVPAVGHWLPRPGAWMDTLRRFMAFPMFATVVWLVWVLGHLSGINGAGALLALLVALGWVIWSLGLEGRSRLVFATLSIAAYAILAGSIGSFVIKMEEPAETASSTPGAPTRWQAWAPGAVQAELAAGRAVFVDFTAAWCITCQYNKKTTLSNADVLATFAAKNVTLLRADWTRRDPAITQELEKLGRSGVPVYVLHRTGQAPVVFSEILDAAELRKAVNRL